MDCFFGLVKFVCSELFCIFIKFKDNSEIFEIPKEKSNVDNEIKEENVEIIYFK